MYMVKNKGHSTGDDGYERLANAIILLLAETIEPHYGNYHVIRIIEMQCQRRNR